MEVREIALREIKVIDNTRGKYENIPELMENIKKCGLLQPIVVTRNLVKKSDKAKYAVVCGHRRFQALKKLGEQTAPCVINNSIRSEQDLFIANLSENLHRKNISPFDEGRFFSKLMKDHKMSKEELAIRLSISKGYIDVSLKVFSSFPVKYKDKIVHVTSGQAGLGKISVNCAAKIAGLVKNGRINKKESQIIIEKVSSGEASSAEIANAIRGQAKGLDEIMGKMEKVTCVQMRFFINKAELEFVTDELKCSNSDAIKRMVYGQTDYYFSRLRG